MQRKRESDEGHLFIFHLVYLRTYLVVHGLTDKGGIIFCKFEIFSRPYGLTNIAAATFQKLKIDKLMRPFLIGNSKITNINGEI